MRQRKGEIKKCYYSQISESLSAEWTRENREKKQI
nr:MAG TPA: hypothetical protein [Caudoviricetes sp.]